MRILGFDPGLERIGVGVIDKEGSRITPVFYGLIQTPRISLPERLSILHEEALSLLETHRPDTVATERLLFTVNKTTAMDVSKALGVLLLAVSRLHLPWAEYSPPEIKQSVVGNGAADKRQVQFMVAKLLGLPAAPKPDDVADALAIAICHAFRGGKMGG
jgi:crossover junction endodeoxyribonuclease RuvC